MRCCACSRPSTTRCASSYDSRLSRFLLRPIPAWAGSRFGRFRLGAVSRLGQFPLGPIPTWARSRLGPPVCAVVQEILISKEVEATVQATAPPPSPLGGPRNAGPRVPRVPPGVRRKPLCSAQTRWRPRCSLSALLRLPLPLPPACAGQWHGTTLAPCRCRFRPPAHRGSEATATTQRRGGGYPPSSCTNLRRGAPAVDECPCMCNLL